MKQENACGKSLQKVIPPTYGLPTETRNMTAGLWFSVVNRNILNIVPRTESQHLETYFAIEMSLNKE